MKPNPIDITKGAVGEAVRIGRWAAGQGLGTLNPVRGRAATAGAPKDLDDVTIARKVETVIFRPADRDKGKIDVNVVDGVVWLRGEAQRPEIIEAIEAETRAIPEVVDVQNLLHLPKTPAPTRSDTPSRARKTGSKATAQAQPRAPPRPPAPGGSRRPPRAATRGAAPGRPAARRRRRPSRARRGDG